MAHGTHFLTGTKLNHFDGDPLHGVVAVTLGVPAGHHHRLLAVGFVGRARPDFIVTAGRKAHVRGPTLPGVTVARWLQRGGGPGLAEINAHVHRPHVAESAPGMTAQRERFIDRMLDAGAGCGDDRFDRQ